MSEPTKKAPGGQENHEAVGKATQVDDLSSCHSQPGDDDDDNSKEKK